MRWTEAPALPLGRLARLLTAPRFEDPDQDRAAAILYPVLLAAFVALTLQLVSLPFTADTVLAPALLDLAYLLPALFALWLLRRGVVRPVGIVATLFGWLINTAGVVVFGGIEQHTLTGYLVVAMAAGFVWSGRAAAGLAAASVLAAMAVVWADGQGLLPPPVIRTPSQVVTAFGVQMGITVVLVTLVLRSLRSALGEAHRSESALVEQNLRLEAEVRERRKAEELYRTLVEHSPLGVVSFDRELKITSANEAAAHILGARNARMALGVELKSSAIHRLREFREAVAACLERGEHPVRVLDWIAPGWGPICVRVHFAPLRQGGAIVGCQMLIEDVAEQRSLEEQLRQAQKMEVVGQLAGGIAHDFNNYLTVILGNAELLAGEPLEDSHQERLGEISSAASRSADLTRQLLAFSRKQVLNPQIIDLNDLVTDLQRMLRRVLGEHIRLETLLGADLSRVRVDPGQLEQVIVNLAVNARDAMPTGGTLSIRTDQVELDRVDAVRQPEVRPGPHVRLQVSDTGIGMDPGTMGRIFEPFFTTKGRAHGTGLGLSTVYGIVSQSGGSIEVESEPGRGTTFCIHLPAATGAVTPAASVRPLEEVGRHGHETVLVVEDDHRVRSLAREILRSHGYTVLVASNGREALQVARRHPATVHLLLTDLMMPEMGGAELADRMLETYPATAVLYMSGYAEDRELAASLRQTGSFVLQKPFTTRELLGEVRRRLDR